MDKISKFREKLVDNFKNIFTDIKCEIHHGVKRLMI